MARFSAQFTQRVRDATDLVELAGEYTELRRVGADRMSGRCPLHDERTPSFTVTPSRQLFKCFGCDAGGDALSFVQLKEGLGFPAALEFLARRAAIELQREDDDPAADERRRRRARQLDLLERAAAFYAAHLRSPRSAQAALAAEYLATRGLNGPIRERFTLGFAPPAGSALLIAGQAAGFAPREIVDAGLSARPRAGGAVLDRFRGRLMFPVCDAQGRVVGFGARKLDGVRGPKYVNSPASPIYRKSELLYAAHHARAAAAKAGIVIVVEGYTDALAMHQAGILNTVALMGTAITDRQVATLKRLAPTVVLMLDGDDAGAQAILRAAEVARPSGLRLLVAPLPAGSDPADLLRSQGAEAVRALIANAHAFERFHVQQHLDRADLSCAEGKDQLVRELRPVFADMPSSAVREDLVESVAATLQLQPVLVRSWMTPAPDVRADDDRRPPAHLPQSNEPSSTRLEERALLLRCISDPAAACDLLVGQPLEQLFDDELHRRAAAHIRDHPTTPTTGLPTEDHHLVSFITGLLGAPVRTHVDPRQIGDPDGDH